MIAPYQRCRNECISKDKEIIQLGSACDRLGANYDSFASGATSEVVGEETV